mgnify:FL=1
MVIDMSIETPRTSKDHLDFYMENDISPVRQNIDDIQKHLERRSSLYQKIGAPSVLFMGKNVLEVGPGSGHNSLYVASCKPARYDLLEPNKTAQNGIRELYSTINLDLTEPHLIEQKLEDFSPDIEYDIVICEAWLGVSNHEREMMKRLGELVSQGGILITTIASPLGSVSNGIRRVLSWGITRNIDNIDKKTKILLEAYSTHLDTINDMSRVHEDWAQDTLINPGFLTMCPQPDMFIDDIGSKFDVYESFPKFNNDWRWYKSLYGVNKKYNEKFLSSYHRNIHNFFDYRNYHAQISKKLGAEIESESFNFISQIAKKEDSNNAVIDDRIIKSVQKIGLLMSDIDDCWINLFEEVVSLMKGKIITENDISKMKFFKKLFGRELIYVSAIKSNASTL